MDGSFDFDADADAVVEDGLAGPGTGTDSVLAWFSFDGALGSANSLP